MKFLIWDLPTRLFHWSLAFSVILAFGLAQFVEKETPLFFLHVVFGVLSGLLLLWRILWGFFGSKHSRWRSLWFSPKLIIQYFKNVISGKGEYFSGHNPGGSIVILALLSSIGITVITGILNPQAEIFENLHEFFPFVVLVLVVSHILGVLLASRMHNENYVLSMFTGMKTAKKNESISHSSKWAALIMVMLVFGTWAYFIKGFDRNNALFTAPGTNWTFQIGEPSIEN